MTKYPERMIHDEEGASVPSGLPEVIDAHAHLFPDVFFQAIYRWFDEYAWPIRYQLSSTEIVELLTARGVSHIVGLHYAHQPGMARFLNTHMAELVRQYPQVTGTATVFPGEDGAIDILTDAVSAGLSGVKLHAHVQCFRMDGQEMEEIYRFCAERDLPLVMHVGNGPTGPDMLYKEDPALFCRSEILERVLKSYPGLRICVPHMGMYEFAAYRNLVERYDNLWLDTAMAYADYFPGVTAPPLKTMRMDRIMYGTDFPNVPYAWDRELKRLSEMGLSDGNLENLMSGTARDFFSIS
jgi:predicted TIM-barrel fold metal-dependent hydrolase